MSGQLKISADTSAVKKSILDIGKSIKDLKGSKVQVFSAEEKKFIKTEMNREIALMKNKLKENRDIITSLVSEQKRMVAGSKEELEIRKKILEGYKTQAKLAKQLGQTQKAVKAGGSVDQASGGLSGMLGSLMAFARLIPGLAAVATIGYAVSKSMKANDQYQAGIGNRNKLTGLGVDDQSFGSPQELARVGLSEQDMIQRRIDATSVLGRKGTSNQTEMQKAAFERSFGLEGGTMTGIAGSLRGSMGGEGANEAQMKLQASVYAAGIEDALAPYLESATQLLTAINENGTTQTDEITNLLAELTRDGQRTPEMMAKAFAGINDSVKGATGESSAFLQTAFARSGIGGGTLGGTKFAMSSGGIMGQDRASLEKRGYNKQLLDNMEKSGMFSGAGQRTGAILDQFKKSGGLKAGESISGITDVNKMVGMGNLANNVFGTKGDQGFDALKLLEKVQNKQMTQKQFDEKLKEMQEGKDPAVSRLDKINGTLAGQTEILNTINTNLMENLGKQAVQQANVLTAADNEGIVGVTNGSQMLNDTGAPKAAGDMVSRIGKELNGGFGERFYDKIYGQFDDAKNQEAMSDDAIIKHAKKMRDSGQGWKGYSDEQIEQKVKASTRELTAKDIGKEVASALREAPIVNKTNVRVQATDGRVNDKTSK